MEASIWAKIISLWPGSSVKVPGWDTPVTLLPIAQFQGTKKPAFWLIGEYKYLTDPATELRDNRRLQKFIERNGVRFGMRDTDHPPVDVERQERIGKKKLGADAGKLYWDERVDPNPPSAAKPTKPVPGNRISDQYPMVDSYWLTQTPQAHHIVEYSTLSGIGVSREGKASEMDKDRLPCVLLMAEFHQRYVTSILKPLHGQSKPDLLNQMDTAYRDIYTKACPALAPLWKVSKIILDEARKLVK